MSNLLLPCSSSNVTLVRGKVWFPLFDSLVTAEIDACIPCQATECPNAQQMREIPKENFGTLYIDFLGPLRSGKTLCVLIDRRRRYPVTKIMKETDASHLIPCLGEVFAIFGLPKKVISNNAPPSNSREIKKFMDVNGIQHRKITPLWPQANQSETFMKPLMKAIRTAHLTEPLLILQQMLPQPHLCRNTCTKLPHYNQ